MYGTPSTYESNVCARCVHTGEFRVFRKIRRKKTTQRGRVVLSGNRLFWDGQTRHAANLIIFRFTRLVRHDNTTYPRRFAWGRGKICFSSYNTTFVPLAARNINIGVLNCRRRRERRKHTARNPSSITLATVYGEGTFESLAQDPTITRVKRNLYSADNPIEAEYRDAMTTEGQLKRGLCETFNSDVVHIV